MSFSKSNSLENILKNFYYVDFKSLFQNLSNTYFTLNHTQENEVANDKKIISTIDSVENIGKLHLKENVIIYNQVPFTYSGIKGYTCIDKPKSLIDFCYLAEKYKDTILKITEYLKLNYNENGTENWLKQEIKNYTMLVYSDLKINTDLAYEALDKLILEGLFDVSSDLEKYLLHFLWEDYFHKEALIDYFEETKENNTKFKEEKLKKRYFSIINIIFELVEHKSIYFSKFLDFDYENWKNLVLKIPLFEERVMKHFEFVLNNITSSLISSEFKDSTGQKCQSFQVLTEVIHIILSRFKILISNLNKLEETNISSMMYSINGNPIDKINQLSEKLIQILIKLMEVSEIFLNFHKKISLILPKIYKIISQANKNLIFEYLSKSLDNFTSIFNLELTEIQINQMIKSKVSNILNFCLYADPKRIEIVPEIFKKEDEILTNITNKILFESKFSFEYLDLESLKIMIKNSNIRCESLLNYFVGKTIKLTKSDKLCIFSNVYSHIKNLFLRENNTYNLTLNNIDKEVKRLFSIIELKKEIIFTASFYSEETLDSIMEMLLSNCLNFEEFFFWYLPLIADIMKQDSTMIKDEQRKNALLLAFKKLQSKLNYEIKGSSFVFSCSILNFQQIIPLFEEMDSLIYLIFFSLMRRNCYLDYIKQNKESKDKTILNELDSISKYYYNDISILWSFHISFAKKKRFKKISSSLKSMIDKIKNKVDDSLYLKLLELIVTEDEGFYVADLITEFANEKILIMQIELKNKNSEIVKSFKNIASILKNRFKESIDKNLKIDLKEKFWGFMKN